MIQKVPVIVYYCSCYCFQKVKVKNNFIDAKKKKSSKKKSNNIFEDQFFIYIKN